MHSGIYPGSFRRLKLRRSEIHTSNSQNKEKKFVRIWKTTKEPQHSLHLWYVCEQLAKQNLAIMSVLLNLHFLGLRMKVLTSRLTRWRDICSFKFQGQQFGQAIQLASAQQMVMGIISHFCIFVNFETRLAHSSSHTSLSTMPCWRRPSKSMT